MNGFPIQGRIGNCNIKTGGKLNRSRYAEISKNRKRTAGGIEIILGNNIFLTVSVKISGTANHSRRWGCYVGFGRKRNIPG